MCVLSAARKENRRNCGKKPVFSFIPDKTVCGILRNCPQMLTSCYTPQTFVLSHIIAVSVFVRGLLQDVATERTAKTTTVKLNYERFSHDHKSLLIVKA